MSNIIELRHMEAYKPRNISLAGATSQCENPNAVAPINKAYRSTFNTFHIMVM